MQKQKIDSITYLVMQNSYIDIQVALFNDNNLLNKKVINKMNASKDLVLELNNLLKDQNYDLKDLTFLAVNLGPSPFTTLRLIIVTANALNFGVSLPLIGIDGLDALINGYNSQDYPFTIALLNAFNNDIYFAIHNKENNYYKKGWKNINQFLEEVDNQFSGSLIRFIGNGVDVYKNEIKAILKDKAFIILDNPQTALIEQIAKMAYENWKNKIGIQEQLNPLYLKDTARYKQDFKILQKIR